MSNCSNHRKDVHGETDMKHLAEEIGNLHYETLSILLIYLNKKLVEDSKKDNAAGRKVISRALNKAANDIKSAQIHISRAWEISKPFMNGSI